MMAITYVFMEKWEAISEVSAGNSLDNALCGSERVIFGIFYIKTSNLHKLWLQDIVAPMCLSIGTPKTINFHFVPNGKLMFLGVPVFKHIRV